MSWLNMLLVLTLFAMGWWIWFGIELWWRTGGKRKVRAELARWNWPMVVAIIGGIAFWVAIIWAIL